VEPLNAMIIRPLRPEDHDAVGALTVAAYADVEPATVGTGYDDELRDVGARAAGAEILVAVDADADGGTGGDAGGGAGIRGAVPYVPGPGSPAAEFTDEGAARIRMLAVATGARRRGVGEALARACVERARVQGRRQVILHSTDNMTAAHRLYRRLGFRRDPALDWEPEPDLWLRGFRLRLDETMVIR
jgi:ribosomal protein S18 acetylase RimI-like enzyme